MPIRIPLEYEAIVYTKEEFDAKFTALLDIKADKVNGAVEDNIAGLTGDEGNLKDLGVGIDDFIITVADGGEYDNSGEL